MWLLIDVDNCSVEYENEDRAEVEKERDYLVDGNYREEDRYIIVFYDRR